MSATDRAEELQPLTVIAVQPTQFADHSKIVVRRARVPAGWLVITSAYLVTDDGLSVAVASTFVPDESGAWLGVVRE